MKLASHNSLTYLEPKNCIFKFFKCIYRCQTKTIQEQYNAVVRYFDFRFSFDNHGNLEFRHGLVAFKTPNDFLFEILDYLNSTEEKNYVRVVLERNSDPTDVTFFKIICEYIVKRYENITFLCGEDVKTKEIIYDFKNYADRSVYEKYGSVSGNILYSLFPILYAKKYNAENMIKYEINKCYLMIDFI